MRSPNNNASFAINNNDENIFNESINDTTLINNEYESIQSNQNKTVVNVDVAQLLKLLSSVCIIMNMFFKNIYNFKQF